MTDPIYLNDFIKLVLKNVIKLAKGSLKNIFQDSFNIISSQQLTHDRSYISRLMLNNPFIKWQHFGEDQIESICICRRQYQYYAKTEICL